MKCNLLKLAANIILHSFKFAIYLKRNLLLLAHGYLLINKYRVYVNVYKTETTNTLSLKIQLQITVSNKKE